MKRKLFTSSFLAYIGEEPGTFTGHLAGPRAERIEEKIVGVREEMRVFTEGVGIS